MDPFTTSRSFALVSAAIMIASLGAGCLDGGLGGGETGLKVGTLTPLTGELKQYGPSGENAVQLAIDEANAEGGVNGKDVGIVTGDTGSVPNQGVSEAQRLITSGGVHAIMGAYSSGVTGAVIENIQTAGVPLISPASTSPALQNNDTKNLFMRTVATDRLQAKVMADLVADKNHTRIAILAINNAYGQGFADFLKQAYQQNLNGIVTDTVFYTSGRSQYDSTLQDLTDEPTKPQAIVFIGYPDSGVTIMRQAAQKGMAGPNGTYEWLFSEGFKTSSFPKDVGKTDGEWITAGYFGTTPVPMPTEFIDKYRNEFGSEPELFADGAYDAAAIMMMAAEKCDCREGQAYQDALFNVTNEPGKNASNVKEGLEIVKNGTDVDYSGYANIEWDEQGDVKTGLYSIWKVNKQGEIVITKSDVRP